MTRTRKRQISPRQSLDVDIEGRNTDKHTYVIAIPEYLRKDAKLRKWSSEHGIGVGPTTTAISTSKTTRAAVAPNKTGQVVFAQANGTTRAYMDAIGFPDEFSFG